MPTISELIKEHSKVPGDIRVRRKSWAIGDWFQPFFPCEESFTYRGKANDREDFLQDATYGDWQLYTEPKSKVMRAQYLMIRNGINRPFITSGFYINDADLLADYPMASEYERQFEREFDQ